MSEVEEKEKAEKAEEGVYMDFLAAPGHSRPDGPTLSETAR